MMQVQQLALDRALKTLDALGAQYKIIMPDGSEHGVLTVTAAHRTRNMKYKFGERGEYLATFMDKMQPGDVAVIPLGQYDLESLRSCASARAVGHWGKGSATVASDAKKQEIQVLRIY